MRYLAIGLAALLAAGCSNDSSPLPGPDPEPIALDVEGSVHTQSGNPLPGASVHLKIRDAVEFSALTDASGNYSLTAKVDESACDGRPGVLHCDAEFAASGYETRTLSQDISCSGPWPQRLDATLQRVCPSASNRILIDATHDGGVWWYPQAGPFLPDQPHQGQALAEYLRRLGYQVDELGRDQGVTANLLESYRFVIRFGEHGTYSAAELAAYADFVQCDVTLILLGDHQRTDPTDELAEMLGITFTGVVRGTVSRLANHPITHGVSSLFYNAGAEVTGYDPAKVEILGWVNGSIPVMGTIASPPAKIFFMGDTHAFLSVDQPFVDNIIAWGF